MFNKYQLFLIISIPFFINCAYHPHPYLDISFKLECHRTEVLCLFIEVFEDDKIYEQLLTRRDICVKMEVDEDELSYFQRIFSNQQNDPYQIQIELEPIRVGSIESSGKFDQMDLAFQITHNCGPEGRIVYCLNGEYSYQGMGNNLVFELNLPNMVGFPGPCSNRWLTSKLKMEMDKRKELS